MKPKQPLPPLARFVDALETCVYCPKLCRAACPVANASASETLTPWGKMSLSYFAHRGDVPLDECHARPAWACTRCDACQERCEHDNDVATVLTRAREAFYDAGVAPPAARSVPARFPEHRAMVRRQLDQLGAPVDPAAPDVLLIGCSYVRHCPDVARQIVDVARHFVAGPLRVARGCCGLPLLLAGDRRGFERTAGELCAELAGAERILVADPGCARTLLEQYPTISLPLEGVVMLTDVVAAELDRLSPRRFQRLRCRYLDPCQLGRGLGRYEPPRAILQHLTGEPAEALVRSGAVGECGGGGGLLPLTYPEVSRTVADRRFEEHVAAGGGQLVTACGASLHRFRRSGYDAVDLFSLVAEALG